MANTTIQNLASYLAGDAAIVAIVSTRIYVNHVPQGVAAPYIYLNKRGEEPWDDLDIIASNAFQESFAVECWGSADSLMGTTGLGWLTRVRLHGKSGTFGTSTIQMMTVQDADEEYLPRGGSGDEGIEMAALEVTITNRHAVLS